MSGALKCCFQTPALSTSCRWFPRMPTLRPQLVTTTTTTAVCPSWILWALRILWWGIAQPWVSFTSRSLRPLECRILLVMHFLKVWCCCFVVVPRASVDRRRTEAAEPRGGFSAQQPSSHQGKNTSKPASTPHQWTFYPFMHVPKSTERAREPSHFLLHPPTVLPGCGQSHNLLCTPTRVWL